MLILGIDADPEVLRARINERTALMLRSGWIDEVRSLLKRGYTAEDPGMKSHGYLDAIEWLKSDGGQAGQVSEDRSGRSLSSALPVLSEKIAAQIRRYAKRQRTWWRGDERIRWIGA